MRNVLKAILGELATEAIVNTILLTSYPLATAAMMKGIITNESFEEDMLAALKKTEIIDQYMGITKVSSNAIEGMVTISFMKPEETRIYYDDSIYERVSGVTLAFNMLSGELPEGVYIRNNADLSLKSTSCYDLDKMKASTRSYGVSYLSSRKLDKDSALLLYKTSIN